MSTRPIGIAIAAVAAASALLYGSGCTAWRSPDTIGAYVDDASITTTVKARMIEDKAVDTTGITVETVNANVTLSGFARSSLEKSTAESVTIKIRGVRSVQNIAVRP